MKSILPIKENKNCYASHEQREVLCDLIKKQILNKSFFLTGGTALSVFYLHHRTSNDLDFFSLDDINLSDIDFKLKTILKKADIKLRESHNFLSLLIKNVRVDFVIDPLSEKEKRSQATLDKDMELMLDTVSNIYSNKLTALVSRNEPKDYIDFYYLHQTISEKTFDRVYSDALKKDAIFEDPPTVAYQIDEGIQFFRENDDLIPNLLIEINFSHFYNFYNQFCEWIYRKVTPA